MQAFFAFVLFQVPGFMLETPSTTASISILSPLQVSAANMANTFPASRDAMEAVLLPGAWVRDALSPYIRCKYKSNFKAPCNLEYGRMFQRDYVGATANLQLLQRIIKSRDMKGQAAPIIYGCSMITVSAAFALVYSVKTAVVGFGLVAYGVIKGGFGALPPAIMMAFLCLYSGFQLGGRPEEKEDTSSGEHKSKESKSTAKKAAAGKGPAKKANKRA